MNHAIRKRRHNRIRSQVKGTSARPRACVFRSATRISVQLIDDTANKTLLSAYGTPAKKQTKLEQASLVGMAVAKQAKKAGIARVVFDRGGYAYQGRVKAVAEAMRAGGLKF